jgi:hypothetical protein
MKGKSVDRFDFLWNTRMTVFRLQNSIEDYLKLKDADYLAVAKEYEARGINMVNATMNFHFRFDWIGQFEEIAEITRRITSACHKVGIKVFDHHSFTILGRHNGETYLGWEPENAVVVDIRTGLPARLSTENKNRYMCINNPEHKEKYKKYILDFIGKTGIDGVMHDDTHFAGQYHCGCKHCREIFKSWFKYELPKTGDFPLDDYSDPVWRDWIRFHTMAPTAHMLSIRKILPKNTFLLACAGGSVLMEGDVHHGGLTLEGIGEATDVLFLEGGGQAFHNRGSWTPRNFFAFWEQLFMEKKFTQALSDHYCEPVIQLHYPANPPEGFFCWALTKMFGQCLWRCDSNLYGGRNYNDEFTEWQPEFDYLNWEKENESLFRFPKECAEIGVVFSQNTKINLGVDAQHHGEGWSGWMQSLREAGFTADGLIDKDLDDPDQLAPYRLIILPNVVCLSGKAADNLRKYVHSGGKLIATHQTSLRDLNGNLRDDFLLADLFGCHFASVLAEEKAAWFPDRRFSGEVLFSGIPLRLPFFPGLKLEWSGESDQHKVLGWLDRITTFHEEPQLPAVVRSDYGKGRVIYLIPRVGSMAYRQGLFPLWNLRYHDQHYMEKKDEKGRIIHEWITPADRNPGKWIFVDEGLDEYRRLISNLVNYLLPDVRIRVTAPPSLIWNVFQVSNAPNDRSGKGPFVIGLLNVGAAMFAHGQEICPPSHLHYPPLQGNIEIRLGNCSVKKAAFYSPDLMCRRDIAVVRTDTECIVRMNLNGFRRTGFVLVEF